MLEKYINLDIYQSNKHNQMRKVGLILTSLIPLFLLFSRVAADTALTITGILFFIHCIKAKNYDYIKQPIAIVLLMLWLWFMVSSIFAIYPIKAFAISFAFIRFILFFFACIYWIFEETAGLKFAAKIIMITMIVTASDALWQFITDFSITGNPKYDDVRLTSFLRRPDVGIYLLKLVFPISGLWIWLAASSANKKNLFLSCSFLLFIICIVCLTGERTATALALLVLVLSLLVIGINNQSLRAHMILAIGGVIIAFAVVVYNSLSIQSRVQDFINDVSNFEATPYGQLFKASILSWQENIITGVGLQQFRYACPTFAAQGLVTYCDLHSHNIYLEILSETGLIGFSLFVIFVILCVYKALVAIIANRENLGVFTTSIFALAGLCTIFFPFSVTMSFITNWSGTLNWLGISLCVSLLRLLKS